MLCCACLLSWLFNRRFGMKSKHLCLSCDAATTFICGVDAAACFGGGVVAMGQRRRCVPSMQLTV